MNKSSSKGEYAQMKIQLKAAEKGFAVSVPTTNEKYDLVIDNNSKLLRTQIKYCNRKSSGKKNNGRLELRLDGGTHNNRKYYTNNDIDLLLVYIPCIDKILHYSSESFHEKKTLYINLNNKKSKHYWGNFIW